MCLYKQERTVFSVAENDQKGKVPREKQKQRIKLRVQRHSSYLYNPRFWSRKAQRDQRQVVICDEQMGRHGGTVGEETLGRAWADCIWGMGFSGPSQAAWECSRLRRAVLVQGFHVKPGKDPMAPEAKEHKSLYVWVCTCAHTDIWQKDKCKISDNPPRASEETWARERPWILSRIHFMAPLPVCTSPHAS